jgi:hypothetical protein
MAIGAVCTANTAGGFRIRFYDLKKRFRFADRPVNYSDFAGPVAVEALAPVGPPLTGPSPATFFLREPYRFPIPDSQILLEAQNFETTANTVQVLYYGQVLRFNAPGLTFPGGPLTGWDWADSVSQYMENQRNQNR